MNEERKEIEIEEKGPSNVKSILVGLGYMGVSLLANLVNKVVLSNYHFNYPAVLMCTQMIILILIFVVKQLSGINKVTLHLDNKFVILFSIWYAVQSVLSMSALEGMNIPLFGVMKRCTSLANLVLAIIILKKGFPPIMRVVGVLMVTGGCIVAITGNVKNDWNAYIYGFFSVITKALYMTTGELLSQYDLNNTDVLFSSVFISLPLFVAFGLIKHEFSWTMTEHFVDSTFIALFCAAICVGALVTISALYSTYINSALTTSLFSSIKSTLQTTFGFVFFHDVKPTPLMITGIVINILGGFIYGYSKPSKKVRPKEECEDSLIEKERDDENSEPEEPKQMEFMP